MSSVNALSASEAHSAHIQQPGIITWALGIRTSIAQDRGLDILRDQIQTQGFAFLEDYLDDILSGPKHESLIEMAKTPGRRKAGNRRTRANSAAVSALKVPSHDNNFYGKDSQHSFARNAPPNDIFASTPLNSFHKVLLQGRDEEQARSGARPKTPAIPPRSPLRPASPQRRPVVEGMDDDTEQLIAEDTDFRQQSPSPVKPSRPLPVPPIARPSPAFPSPRSVKNQAAVEEQAARERAAELEKERERVRREEMERVERERVHRATLEAERERALELEKERERVRQEEMERIEQERLRRAALEAEEAEKLRKAQEELRRMEEKIRAEREVFEEEKRRLEARQAKEREELERQRRELKEREAEEAKRREEERIREKERQEEEARQMAERARQLELERIEKERREQERIEKERLERLELERQEKQRLEKERARREEELRRLEERRLEEERLEKARQLEFERQREERQRELQRLEEERLRKEWIEKERREMERLERERLEKVRLEEERMQQERRERERVERERLEEVARVEEEKRLQLEAERQKEQELLQQRLAEKERALASAPDGDRDDTSSSQTRPLPPPPSQSLASSIHPSAGVRPSVPPSAAQTSAVRSSWLNKAWGVEHSTGKKSLASGLVGDAALPKKSIGAGLLSSAEPSLAGAKKSIGAGLLGDKTPFKRKSDAVDVGEKEEEARSRKSKMLKTGLSELTEDDEMEDDSGPVKDDLTKLKDMIAGMGKSMARPPSGEVEKSAGDLASPSAGDNGIDEDEGGDELESSEGEQEGESYEQEATVDNILNASTESTTPPNSPPPSLRQGHSLSGADAAPPAVKIFPAPAPVSKAPLFVPGEAAAAFFPPPASKTSQDAPARVSAQADSIFSRPSSSLTAFSDDAQNRSSSQWTAPSSASTGGSFPDPGANKRLPRSQEWEAPEDEMDVTETRMHLDELRSNSPHEDEEEENEEDEDPDAYGFDGGSESGEYEDDTRQTNASVATTGHAEPEGISGLFSHATNLISKTFGVNKKPVKSEVESLRLAQIAKEKEQEEREKKIAKANEMEARKQASRKQKMEDERARQETAEKKRRQEEAERKKREREDNTANLKFAKSKKVDEDLAKKRKVEPEKKAHELKKVPSRDFGSSRIAKPIQHAQTSSSQPVFRANASTSYKNPSSSQPSAGSSSSTVKLVKPTAASAETSAPRSILTKKQAAAAAILDGQQPAQALQAQMAARLQSQLAKERENEKKAVASESIELPDINSEYSDSDDEDRPKNFNPPDWAQDGQLQHALQLQSEFNPDVLFGAVRPLHLEDMFKKQHRFRARTSSANWSGTDRLTAMEELDYARRMGYKH